MGKFIERPDLQTAFENVVRLWQKQNMRGETDINELIGRMRSLVERAEWKTVNRWISVEDALPEQGERVIVAIFGSDMIMPDDGETLQDAIERSRKEGYITVGFIGSDGWYGADWFPLMVHPSYWMPKPELPEND